MKKLLTYLICLFSLVSTAQLNMSQLGHVDIPSIHGMQLNDIWGYVDEAGNEYALVGAVNGVSIVDVTDPATASELAFFFGPESIWRDLKTYGDYCYVSTEAEAGLWIIDMSPLPASTSMPITTYNGPEGEEWSTVHNIYQDDGYLYVFGAGRDNGGVIILDVATDPWNPVEVGTFDSWYCHDGYVRNDTGYFAHIYDGFFSVVDLTDKENPILLGTAFTPSAFAHNIWLSDDGDYVFTSDEVSGGYIGSFDVSNPSSIAQVDKIQSSPGEGRIPHNVHVNGDYLYTSYYNDGVLIHDISNPANMVEVGNFDTSPAYATTTFNGCWGVYPYLPSGNIIASDREEGLYILSADEHPGSYLEGNITEMGTGSALNNVDVTIDGTTITDYSDIFGDYATGTEGEGTFDVTYHKVLYYPETVPITFSNGSVVTQDIVLEKIPQYSLTVEVLDATTMSPVEGADVLLEHSFLDLSGVTDASGQVVLDMYYEDNYQAFAGKWGYETSCYVDTLIDSSTGMLTFYIDQGIYDDFVFDNGWTTFGDAARGHWEREIPVGVGSGENIQNPYADVSWDCGDYAWITGNGTSASNTQEVNDGEVVLISPTFDLTTYVDPHINYSAFFFNKYGAPPDDTLNIYISNGSDIVLIDQRFAGGTTMSKWIGSSIPLSGLISLTSNMQIMLTLSDYTSSENITEAAFDQFSVTEFSMSDIEEIEEKVETSPRIYVYPNPTDDILNINGPEKMTVQLFDVQGRLIKEYFDARKISLANLNKGIYVLFLKDDQGRLLQTERIVKR